MSKIINLKTITVKPLRKNYLVQIEASEPKHYYRGTEDTQIPVE